MALDTDQGLRNVANNQALYRKVLQRFVESHGNTVAEIEQALARGDKEEAQRAAHTVKGLAATLGTMHYAETAVAVDAALKAGADCQAQLAAMAVAEKEALEDIRNFLAQP